VRRVFFDDVISTRTRNNVRGTKTADTLVRRRARILKKVLGGVPYIKYWYARKTGPPCEDTLEGSAPAAASARGESCWESLCGVVLSIAYCVCLLAVLHFAVSDLSLRRGRERRIARVLACACGKFVPHCPVSIDVPYAFVPARRCSRSELC